MPNAQSLPPNARPRLLYVSHVDIAIRFLLPHLDGARAAGFEVDVACALTQFEDEVRPRVDNLFVMPFRRQPLHPGNITGYRKLKALIAERNYLIVHTHTPVGGFVGRAATVHARGKSKAPVCLYTPHGYHFHEFGKPRTNKIYRAIETYAGQNWSDAVLTVNVDDYVAAKDTVVPGNKLYWTRGQGITLDIFDENRVSLKERQAVRSELGADSPDALVVTYVAEFIPRKRHRDALEAFAKVKAKHPNAVLIFAGKGPLWEETKQQAAQWGVAEQTRFLGFRRDIPALLSATDVLLFPSEQEGLPCAIQEAFGMAVPLVASDIRGCRDLIDESCGRLAPLGNTNALASALDEVLAMAPAERKALGRAGREKMLREFASPRCVSEWQGVYVRLLEEHGLPVPPGLRERAANPPMVPPVTHEPVPARIWGAKRFEVRQ